jgi:hypothetical protein
MPRTVRPGTVQKVIKPYVSGRAKPVMLDLEEPVGMIERRARTAERQGPENRESHCR